MTGIDDALARLRASDPVREAELSGTLADGIADAGIRFASIGGALGGRWMQALRELGACIQPLVPGDDPVLSEGGVYHGAWIESTGTINAEVLDRFAPAVTRSTHLLFADHARTDGLIPTR
jgi:hypothetical protein